MARHVLGISQDRTGAVAVRAAFESAVPLGRGDEVNGQAEMADLLKCRGFATCLKSPSVSTPQAAVLISYIS
jgi:hypothetical protein